MTFSIIDQQMMKRCFHLAQMGSYHVRTNPMVGSVITYENKIIGEGYHKKYGGPHAEIEALNSIPEHKKHLLQQSHIYVSLEPCHHVGKTPPCVDAVLEAGIPKVTICNLDPNPQTHGLSVAKLRANKVNVRVGLLSKDGAYLNRKFLINQKAQIPYVVLKWAQSKDGYMGRKNKQVWLSNEASKLVVHRWREEIDGIMVGTDTAIIDDPELTNRRPQGRSPLRVILDSRGRIPNDKKVICDENPSLIYTSKIEYHSHISANKKLVFIPEAEWSIRNILSDCYQKGMSTIMIEGGASLLKHMISEELWHEARIIHTPQLLVKGIKAPYLKGRKVKKYKVLGDNILIINNLNK